MKHADRNGRFFCYSLATPGGVDEIRTLGVLNHVCDAVPQSVVARDEELASMKVNSLVLALFLVLGVSSAVAAQSPQPEWKPQIVHAAIAASIVSHACDLATSAWALGREGGEFRETNPTLRWASHDPMKLAVAKMSIAAGLSYGVLQLHKTHPKLALATAIAQTVVVGYVARENARLVKGR